MLGQRATNCQQRQNNIDRLTTLDKLYGNLSVSTDTGEPRGDCGAIRSQSSLSFDPFPSTKTWNLSRPPAASCVRHVFAQEPKLPPDSLCITGYNERATKALLRKWRKEYGNRVQFHKMKFNDFKKVLDLTFCGPRHALRFDLWDHITRCYLYHHQAKLTDFELAYIQG